MGVIYLLLFCLLLNSCLTGGGSGTDTAVSGGSSTTSCSVSSSAVSSTLIQTVSWSLVNSNQSNLAVSVNTSRFSEFVANPVTCDLIYEVAVVSGAYVELFNLSQTSYTYPMSWTDIGFNSSNNFNNLNLNPNSGYAVCLRARIDGTQTYTTAKCKTFRVPDFTPPATMYCSPLSIRRITYSSGSPAEYNTCTAAGGTPNRQYALADSSSNVLTAWQISLNNIFVSGLTTGLNYKLLTKTVNGDGYSSSISVKDFYLPKPLSLKIKFKSKSQFDPTVYNCEAGVSTFDTSVNAIKSNYPTCSLIQNSSTQYTIDCSGVQSCPSNAQCTAVSYVTTGSGFCSNFWSLPTLDLQTNY